MTGRGIVAVDRNRMQLREVDIGTAGDWDLVVELEASAVSVGTESHCLDVMDAARRQPYVSGYAPVGRVVQAGREARALFPEGARVTYFAPRPPVPAAGVGQTCGGHISPAIIDVNPAARDLLGPDTYCVTVPESVPSERAAFAGVSAVSYLGVTMCNPRPGDKVVVLGQGIIGLFATRHFALRGAEVLAVDSYPLRLQAAKASGASHVVDASREKAHEAVRRLWPGGADVVADTTGLYPVIEESIPAVRRFGTYVFLGWCKGPGFTLEKLQGTRVFEAFFPWTLQGPHVAASLRLMALGALPVDPLVSHRFSPQDAGAVYDFVRGARDQYVGILLDWGKMT
jgi:L-iditol 2-dehydrogenase